LESYLDNITVIDLLSFYKWKGKQRRKKHKIRKVGTPTRKKEMENLKKAEERKAQLAKIKLTEIIAGLKIFTLKNIPELKEVKLQPLEEFRVTKISHIRLRRYAENGAIHKLIDLKMELTGKIPNEIFYQNKQLKTRNFNEFNFIKLQDEIPNGEEWESIKFYNFKLIEFNKYKNNVYGAKIRVSKKNEMEGDTDLFQMDMKIEIKAILLPKETETDESRNRTTDGTTRTTGTTADENV